MKADIYSRIQAITDQMEGIAMTARPKNEIVIDMSALIRSGGVTAEIRDQLAQAQLKLSNKRDFYLAAHLEILVEAYDTALLHRAVIDRYD